MSIKEIIDNTPIYKTKEVPEAVPPERPPDEAVVWSTLAGKLVTDFADKTETDPMAVLSQLIVTYGNALNQPYAMVGATKHRTNLFMVLVGKTAVARKGDAENIVRESFLQTDQLGEKFLSPRKGGITSGEGIITAVRDSSEDKDGNLVGGVEDKRLLIMESEFARLLSVMGRSGNTISHILRDAYDGRTLQNTNKNSSETATDPHISLISHITHFELTKEFSSVNMANGFGNRNLWFWVKRQRYIPNPAIFQINDNLRAILERTIRLGRTRGLMYRSPDAAEYWASVYPDLTDSGPGFVGALSARNDANALRLSMIFALMRGSELIEIEDIQAALEIIYYSTRSIEWLFEGADINPKFDDVIHLLQAGGSLSRSIIRERAFGNHTTSPQMNDIRDSMTSKGMIAWDMKETNGRPVEMWRLA